MVELRQGSVETGRVVPGEGMANHEPGGGSGGVPRVDVAMGARVRGRKGGGPSRSTLGLRGSLTAATQRGRLEEGGTGKEMEDMEAA